MSAVYDLFKSPKRDAENGGNPVLYARVVSHKTISFSHLVEEMADASSFTPGDLRGVLSTITHAMVRHLSEGNSVELEGLGYFSPILKCERSTERSEISTASVQFTKIRFRTCSCIKEKMATMRLQRKGKSPASVQKSVEEKLSMVLAFLAKQTILTRSNYQKLVGCDKTQAIRDLNNWIEAGIIHRYGSGNQIVYLDK
ncbi:MAG: HU family DNA-binding protein [Bacteroidales bacterium]|nr:HU family DNA-binding protein [Bacteroidales bacterium]MDD4820974.1 HU family DNA-binding protein [Bacteroidales bacterium]